MTNLNGIRYEISKPVRNQKDGYYYQRVRQVDDKGTVVGFGDQMIRSARPDSRDGLFDPNGNVAAAYHSVKIMGHIMQTLLGVAEGNPRWVGGGLSNIAGELSTQLPQALKRDYQKWPGTDEPWEGEPSGNNGLTKPNDGLGKQGMSLPGSDLRSGILSNATDLDLLKKTSVTANEPSQSLNARAGKADSDVTTTTQLFQDPNGRPVADTTGWQNGMFVSPSSSVQQTPRRLISSQLHSDFDLSAVDRQPVDYGAAAGATPVPPEDMSELLKLRSMIQAVGSRGLFPVQ